MDKLISELVTYGIEKGLIDIDDKIYVINRLLEEFEKKSFTWADVPVRSLDQILEDFMAYSVEAGILEDESVTLKDLYDTKIMGLITPPPSQVRNKFKSLYAQNPKAATDYFYKFSQGILQSAGNGSRTSLSYIKLRELFCSKLTS